jgi:hypothetical protein
MKSTHAGVITTDAAGGSATETERTTEGTDAEPEPLHKDTVYHLLQNERRRLALRYLREVESETDLGEMAVQVAAWENDTTTANVTSDMRQRVYIALYQSHLPKLADEGVLDYDKDRKRISRRQAAAQLDRYLTPAERARRGRGEGASPETTDARRAPAHVAVTAVGLMVLLASQLSAGFDPLTLAVTLALAVAIGVQQFGLPRPIRS